MTKADHNHWHSRTGDQIVRRPRATDGIGHALRGVFAATALPPEMEALIGRLDRVSHH